MSINVGEILAFMTAAIGKPYSENTATDPATGEEYRFGPTEYDCSGLVYSALKKAGVDIPASDAIANLEAEWLSKQPGVTEVKSTKDIKTGDILFFTGASPDPSPFGGIGHVGIAKSPTELLSAYDTALGVTTTPISQDSFVIGMRLGSSPAASPTGSQGGLGGLLSIPSEITSFFSDADKFVNVLMWIVNPASWLRIGAFLVGIALLLFAIYAFVKVGEGESPLPKAPQTIPVPVPI